MRINFCTHIEDENGTPLIFDVECELDVSVELDAGVPRVEVDAIYIDGVDILRSRSTLFRIMAATIKTKAEDDDGVLTEAMENDGISYRGLGGNDPDGHFVRVS